MRISALAAVYAHFAAVFEVAVVRHVDGVGNLAGDRIELVDLLADDAPTVELSGSLELAPYEVRYLLRA